MNATTINDATANEDAVGIKKENLYSVGITIPVDDTEDRAFRYHFSRPSMPSYDRYIKSAAKLGITKASHTFMLDCVVPTDKERLQADMAEYPGIAITIGNKLTELLGLTDTVNLKKL